MNKYLNKTSYKRKFINLIFTIVYSVHENGSIYIMPGDENIPNLTLEEFNFINNELFQCGVISVPFMLLNDNNQVSFPYIVFAKNVTLAWDDFTRLFMLAYDADKKGFIKNDVFTRINNIRKTLEDTGNVKLPPLLLPVGE